MTINTTSKYYVHSLPSTIGGSFAIFGAISLLVRDAYDAGPSLEHFLMPVLVGLTVLFGHECWRALKEFKVVSAIGLGALALFGSGIIVTETMGRRAEIRDTKTAIEEKGVDQYAALLANLNKANQLVTEAESWVANECRTGIGPKCRGVTYTRDQRLAHAEKLRAQAEAHKAPAPVDAKANRIAALATVVGLTDDAEAAKRIVQTFDPYTLSLFLELGGIFGFGFGIRHRKVAETEKEAANEELATIREQFFSPDPDQPPPGNRRKQRLPANVVTFSGKHPAISAIEKAGRPVCNNELARLMSVSPGEASKRWQEVADQLDVCREGKFVILSLKKSAAA